MQKKKLSMSLETTTKFVDELSKSTRKKLNKNQQLDVVEKIQEIIDSKGCPHDLDQTLTDEEQKHLLAINSLSLTYQQQLVEQSTWLISFVEKPQSVLYGSIIKRYPEYINKISRKSKETMEILISYNYKILKYLPEISEELQLIAISIEPKTIKFFNNPSFNVQKYAYDNGGYEILAYIDDISKEMAIHVVSEDPEDFKYIKKPSLEIQKLAVQMEPKCIRFIRKPSDEIMEIAILKDAGIVGNLEYDISDNLKKMAIKANPWSINHFMNVSDELIRYAVSLDGSIIESSRLQIDIDIDDDLIILASKTFSSAMLLFNNITKITPEVILNCMKLLKNSDRQDQISTLIDQDMHLNQLSSETLSAMYINASIQDKKIIKEHRNYKTDAQLILSKISKY